MCNTFLCEVNWRPVVKFKEHIREKSRGLAGSSICEESINIAKNNRKQYWGKRYRKPEAMMRTVLASNLQTQRHEYIVPSVDVIRTKKNEVLTKETFMPSKGKRSLPFEEIVSSTSTTT